MNLLGKSGKCRTIGFSLAVLMRPGRKLRQMEGEKLTATYATKFNFNIFQHKNMADCRKKLRKIEFILHVDNRTKMREE